MKRVIALLLSAFLICTISAPAFAVNEIEESEITQFSYVVLDENGNVVKQGITPDFKSRYSWGGITFGNNETVYFRKADGTNFCCLKNTRVTSSITKDRNGDVQFGCLEVDGSTSSNGYYVHKVMVSGLGVTSYFSTGTPFYGSDTGFYVLIARNYTSDPMTITSASLTF